MQEIAEPELWTRYRVHDDDRARDRLFLHYVPWASAIAKSVHRRLRVYNVDREDFVQNATIGLLEAMARFDPTRGIPFSAYAKPRVRGAVFNGLRAILGERLAPSDESRFAERLNDLHDAPSEGSAFNDVIDSILGLGTGYLLDEAASHMLAREGGLEYARTAELEERIASAVSMLPDRLKMILQLHYFQFVPFQEIAARMGVTKGRVSQLHKAALGKLRDALSDL
ncbi:MAG TPA: sigma-70 family RNA polymerase sigma factor [Xanthomonadaceae bacterium]|jgi:RNA polymerase sigma factor for flagellar operon FliA